MDLKKFYRIKTMQFSIYLVSIILTFLYPHLSTNWPFYLVLIGILLGNLLPIQYRSNFFSTDPGLILKRATRRLENSIDLSVTCIVIFFVLFFNFSW